MQVKSTSGVRLIDNIGDPVTTIRIDLPLSADELVAALYNSGAVAPELADDEYVSALIATEFLTIGIGGVQEAVSGLARPADPEWLAFCRRRVAEVYGVASLVAVA